MNLCYGVILMPLIVGIVLVLVLVLVASVLVLVLASEVLVLVLVLVLKATVLETSLVGSHPALWSPHGPSAQSDSLVGGVA